MPQFMMQGKAITSCSRYREFFSAEELLRQREVAAGFLYQHFRMLTPADQYHCDAFYNAVFLKENPALEKWQDYFSNFSVLLGFVDFSKKKFALKQLAQQKESFGGLILEIWTLAQGTNLSASDKGRLFCLLAAGCSLAGVDHCNLSSEAAELAFLRKPRETEDETQWLSFQGSADIRLEARRAPYRILLGTNLESLLLTGNAISFRKIVALPHAQGNSNVPVTLALYRSEQDLEPELVQFYPGDYRYVNCVSYIPVYVHPTCQVSPACRMERIGGHVHFFDGSTTHTYPCSHLQIVDFAVEANTVGYLLLTTDGLDDFNYSRKNTLPLPKKDIVQMAFRGSECLLLNKFGKVYSSLTGIQNNVTVARLGDYLQNQGGTYHG